LPIPMTLPTHHSSVTGNRRSQLSLPLLSAVLERSRGITLRDPLIFSVSYQAVSHPRSGDRAESVAAKAVPTRSSRAVERVRSGRASHGRRRTGGRQYRMRGSLRRRLATAMERGSLLRRSPDITGRGIATRHLRRRRQRAVPRMECAQQGAPPLSHQLSYLDQVKV
jgi:hypothetical protein